MRLWLLSLGVSNLFSRFHFPSDSFFCKYFKRLTGMSPASYRNS